jgi:hypothetical protein
MLNAECEMLNQCVTRNAQRSRNAPLKRSAVDRLAFVAPFGRGIAQCVVNNLAENFHQFVGFLNHRKELRRQQPSTLANAQSESRREYQEVFLRE